MKKAQRNVELPLETPHREWTFFTNHAHVLITLACAPNASLRQIAIAVGITERGVQKIITDLAEAGFLKRAKVGRRNEYRLNLSQPLRHPIERHRSIGEVITLLYPQVEGALSAGKRR